MNEPIDLELLRRFVGDAEDRVFSEIVARHINLVYSAARRMVVDPHLAEDVTQSVFTELARQASSISNQVGAGMPLSAWLHVTTRNLAAKLVRTEERRRARELQATSMTPESLDPDQFEIVFAGILNQISNPARAIVLREREAFTTPGKPGLSRTYLFADGHSEIRYSENGDFTAWEQERTAVLQSAPAGGQQ